MVDENRDPEHAGPAEVRLTEETVQYLQKTMQEAVSTGMRKVIEDREVIGEFWSEAFEILRDRAQKQTGRMVLWSLRGILSRLAQFLTLGLIVYMAGGWTALAKSAQALWALWGDPFK